jgi:hypothetical protein
MPHPVVFYLPCREDIYGRYAERVREIAHRYSPFVVIAQQTPSQVDLRCGGTRNPPVRTATVRALVQLPVRVDHSLLSYANTCPGQRQRSGVRELRGGRWISQVVADHMVRYKRGGWSLSGIIAISIVVGRETPPWNLRRGNYRH